MSRNASGTYTLPAGNPVTTGTTITSTWANSTFSDLATEVTNSLDRQGRGAMTAPLQAAAGTAAEPGVTFSGDTDTGIHHPAADEFRLTAGGVDVAKVTATYFTPLKPIALQNGTVDAPALAFVNDTTTGFYLNVAGEVRLVADGNEVQEWDATASESRLKVPLKLQSTNPASTEAFTNTLTPLNIPKAFGIIGTDGLGAVSAAGGFNVATVTLPAADTLRVTFAQAMADTNYTVVRTAADGATGLRAHARLVTRNAAYFEVKILDSTGATVTLTTAIASLEFVVFGAQ